MAGIPSAPTGKSHLPSAVGKHEGDTPVSQPKFQTFKVKKADVPAIMAMLEKVTSEKAGSAPDLVDTTVTVKSHNDRSITSTETTHSLKYRSDPPHADEFDLQADIDTDEGIEENIDTESVSGEWDAKSGFSTADEPDLGIYETQSEDSGFEGDRDEDVQLKDEDPGSVSSQSSIKERLSSALDKVKTLRKRMTDWIISVPQKVNSKLPRKAKDSMVLHAPSPKALKERITGKVTDASLKMPNLSIQAKKEIHQLSKSQGDSEYAEVDQLEEVKQRIIETEQRLYKLDNERAALLKVFDAEDALERLDAINREVSELALDMKSYKTAEKMLQSMRKPIAKRVQKNSLAAENNAYADKVKTYRESSTELSEQLEARGKEYTELKSSLKEQIQEKQRKIKQLKSEIKKQEKRIHQIERDVESPDKKIIHMGRKGTYDYDELKVNVEELKERLQSEENSLLNINDNIGKKKDQLNAVKEEQSEKRKQMRRDKNEHERMLNVLNRLSKDE